MFFKINKSMFLHDSPQQKLDDADDSPPTLMVTGIVVVSFIVVFIAVVLSFPLTEKLADMQKNDVDSGMGNMDRIIYISGEKQIMSTYKKLDDGHYRIPIQEAMKMVVATQGDLTSSQVDSNKETEDN